MQWRLSVPVVRARVSARQQQQARAVRAALARGVVQGRQAQLVCRVGVAARLQQRRNHGGVLPRCGVQRRLAVVILRDQSMCTRG